MNLRIKFERRDSDSREQRFILGVEKVARLAFIFLERVAILAALRLAASESQWIMAAYWIALGLLTAPISLWAQKFAMNIKASDLRWNPRLLMLGAGAALVTVWFAAIMAVNWFAAEVVFAVVATALKQAA